MPLVMLVVVMTQRDANGRFIKGASGNPKGRPARADSLRQMMEGSAEEVAAKVLEAAQAGDLRAAELVLSRCIAPVRPAHTPVTFTLDESAPLAEQGRSILAAIAQGEVPPDTGKHLLDALAALSRVAELDEITRRLDALEERNG